MRPIHENELDLIASIDTVSKLLNVPKSTLRYYDDKGIIPSRRAGDQDNSYRIYTRQDILTLFDFLLYRQMDISVKDIKDMNALPLETRLYKLFELIEENQKKIQTLVVANSELLRNVSVIQKYLSLKEKDYRFTTEIEIENIKEYHMLEPVHANQWLHGPFTQSYAMIYDCSLPTMPVYEGLTGAEDFDSMVIWQPGDSSGKYVECLTKTGYATPESPDIEKHLDWIREHGLTAGKIICLFLLPIKDEETGERYDVYHTWIELL